MHENTIYSSKNQPLLGSANNGRIKLFVNRNPRLFHLEIVVYREMVHILKLLFERFALIWINFQVVF